MPDSPDMKWPGISKAAINWQSGRAGKYGNFPSCPRTGSEFEVAALLAIRPDYMIER